MSLIITAQVVDPDGRPFDKLAAQVCLFTIDGLPKIAASGAVVAGLLKIESRITITDYQPRLQLQLLRGETFVAASDRVVASSAGSCDFGRVTFNPLLIKLITPIDEAMAPVSDGESLESLKAALTLERDEALAAQAQQLALDKAAALTALSKQLTVERTAALAAQSQQLALDKAAALATQAQQLAADKAAALATQAQQLAADRAAALATQSQQLAADRAAALAARTTELTADKATALANLGQQHAQVLAARDAALAERDGKIAELSQQLAVAVADAPHETSIEDLAQTTASQIQRVQKSLRDGQGGLQLGKISLNLKVLPGSSGGRVSLPQARDIEKVGAQALGSIDLAFVPDTAPARTRPGLTAPRLLGYTEAMARRKLAERGLGVDIVHQLVTTAAEHGRVVLQRPAPKAPVAEGSVVLIAIGRQDEHDPRPS